MDGQHHEFLQADGLHPSYEGVAVMASHIRQLCVKETNSSSSSWADSASVPRYRIGALTKSTAKNSAFVL
ncbi:hypothetical protein HPB48_001051 [Haemaphysalis longicornis]|uniref:Uncharacterized protein n=1 Tax=Haemaphysalis longicornis TaxID=44386 RepID=A0A9J6GWB9_HAELO|nr:hypothetical protein HPB48_001051 [Haemaphysalis longicornis]